jgi:hypothetical protein
LPNLNLYNFICGAWYHAFECRILRKIFGPVQNGDGSWRIRMNYKLSEVVKNTDIVRFIKSGRMAWLGHVMWMDEKRTPKRI